jgi:hypothetical protein
MPDNGIEENAQKIARLSRRAFGMHFFGMD